MKLAERLRKCLMAGTDAGTLTKAPITIEAADLLDECERALQHAALNMPHPDQFIDDTLAKLRAQERG